MHVDLFIPCFIDQLFPDTAWNMIKVLEKAGCTVHYNEEQTCCGQPMVNTGYLDDAVPLVRNHIDAFANDPLVLGYRGTNQLRREVENMIRAKSGLQPFFWQLNPIPLLMINSGGISLLPNLPVRQHN